MINCSYRGNSVNMMKISEIASEKIDTLPLDKQQQVLDFIEFIQSKIEPETMDNSVKTNKKQQKTVLEKIGGYPNFLLESSGNLSDRDIRKKIIADKIKEKHQKRHK